jgi:hypothetical protein
MFSLLKAPLCYHSVPLTGEAENAVEVFAYHLRPNDKRLHEYPAFEWFVQSRSPKRIVRLAYLKRPGGSKAETAVVGVANCAEPAFPAGGIGAPGVVIARTMSVSDATQKIANLAK